MRCGVIIGNDRYGFTVQHNISNNVEDRLCFSGAWRSLNYADFGRKRTFYCQLLALIQSERVNNCIRLTRHFSRFIRIKIICRYSIITDCLNFFILRIQNVKIILFQAYCCRSLFEIIKYFPVLAVWQTVCLNLYIVFLKWHILFAAADYTIVRAKIKDAVNTCDRFPVCFYYDLSRINILLERQQFYIADIEFICPIRSTGINDLTFIIVEPQTCNFVRLILALYNN